ncbi:MAG: biotin transporter BioY [Candidatus Omnitrophica bacterium]|nr:biotin transporter BioY [Candidatus Omnitrophota bacterium]
MESIVKRWIFDFLKWKQKARLLEKIVVLFIFALLTGVSAQIFIKLPFTPVPITGQVFMVLLSGVLLGKKHGCLSQMIYIVGGIAGIPWFSGGKSGFLFIPTFGYIIGFVPAAWIVGYLYERNVRNIRECIFAMLVGIAIIYLFGAAWFSLLLGTNLEETIKMAVVPFIPFDILKAYLAGYFAFYLFSKTDQNML